MRLPDFALGICQKRMPSNPGEMFVAGMEPSAFANP